MVNLLVVALLLAPCLLSPSLAYVDIVLQGFTFLCMKQDGSHVPLAYSNVVVRDKGVGQGPNLGNRVFQTDANGKLTLSLTGYGGNLDDVMVWIDALCATYRGQCPSIENRCRYASLPHVTLNLPYGKGHAHKYRGGAFLSVTPQSVQIAANKEQLRTAMMTGVEEFCQPPYGKGTWQELPGICSFNSVPQTTFSYKKKESNNIDNGAVPAAFEEGRSHKIVLEDFTFLCMKQDGSHVPLAYSNVVVRDKPVGKGDNLGLRVFQTDANGMLSLSLHGYGGNLNDVMIWIDADCATYRSQCPSIENRCRYASLPHVTTNIPYGGGHAHKYRGGAFLSVTPQFVQIAAKKEDLRTLMMTNEEFCQPPYGKGEYLTGVCSFNSVQQASVNGAATADFKGRPARLAKGLF